MTTTLALGAASALALVPLSPAAATAPDPVVSYAAQAQPCDVTLPGGVRAEVTRDADVSTARVLDPGSARSGLFSFDNGGHQVLLPSSALSAVASGATDVSAYDTEFQAQRQCGWTAQRQSGTATNGYRLGELTVHTIGSDGAPLAGFVMLTNVDNENLARPILDTTDGLTKLAVPQGHYSAVLVVNNGSDYQFVLDPEFTVGASGQATLDARTATVTATTPSTPKPADLESSSFGVSRGDGTNVADWFDFFNLDPTPMSFSINPVAAPAHGVLTVNPQYEFSSPPGTAAPYQYHISEATDHVTSFPTAVNPASLATVTRDYDAPQVNGPALSINAAEPLAEAESGKYGYRGFSEIDPGTSRTEYFSASPDLAWLSVVDEDVAGHDELFTSPHVYLPGQHTVETFHQGAEHPGVALQTVGNQVLCAACSSPGTLQFDIYPVNDNNPGDYGIGVDPLAAGESESATFQLQRNGSLVATGEDGLLDTGIAVANGNAHYQLTENTTRQIGALPLSTASQTTWSFAADPGHGQRVPASWTCPAGGTACSTLPLLFAYYNADTSPTDGLTAGPHTLNLTVQHQQDAAATPITGASVSLSYDDGATWVPATVHGRGGQYTASFAVPGGLAGGFVAIRVAAWDAAGDRIDQTVQRAYAAQ